MDIQNTQNGAHQALQTLQLGVSATLGGQAQELAAIRQFQDNLGPIEGWATGVNTQVQGLNGAVTVVLSIEILGFVSHSVSGVADDGDLNFGVVWKLLCFTLLS